MKRINELDYSKLVPSLLAATEHFKNRYMDLIDYQNDKTYPIAYAIVKDLNGDLFLYSWDRWHGGGGWIKHN